MRPALEVADIFRRHGAAYPPQPMPAISAAIERRVMAAIEACRTAALGGHVEQCADCGLVRCAYNSCRNRHCPKCQGLARAEWLEARQAELLPVPYFHVVFTLPAPVAEIAFQNKARGLRHPVPRRGRDAARHRRRSQASRRRDRRGRRAAHLGADPAPPSASALHRPGRRPLARPDALGRLPARLLPAGARALAPVPRAVPDAAARGVRGRRAPLLRRRSPTLAEPAAFAARLDALRRGRMGRLRQAARSADPSRCSAYLGRYTHRVAIANSRLVGLADGQVSFPWKDYRQHGKTKVMTLAADEFIRRFLLHALPDGFHRIRHYRLPRQRPSHRQAGAVPRSARRAAARRTAARRRLPRAHSAI